MTLLKDFLEEQFVARTWCEVARPLVKNAEEMYNGTRRPDFWAQVLAFTNIAKAKAVIAQLVRDYGALLTQEGNLKTKMLAFTDALTEQEYSDLIAWAEPYRRGTYAPDLYALLYSAAKFIQTESPEYIKAPITYMLKFEQHRSNISYQQAIEIVYPQLRALVTLEEWRGAYE
jgi:hypothetical protein